jgi:hypothetical protein
MSANPILDSTLEFALSDAPRLIAALGHTREILGFDAAELLAGQPSFLDRIHPSDSDIAATLFSSQAESRSCITALTWLEARLSP